MINLATLPTCQPQEQFVQGQRFIITGQNFDLWPNKIVSSYAESTALVGVIGSYESLLILVEKTNTTLTFEATMTFTWETQHHWTFFAAPYTQPRELLSYIGV